MKLLANDGAIAGAKEEAGNGKALGRGRTDGGGEKKETKGAHFLFITQHKEHNSSHR